MLNPLFCGVWVLKVYIYIHIYARIYMVKSIELKRRIFQLAIFDDQIGSKIG